MEHRCGEGQVNKKWRTPTPWTQSCLVLMQTRLGRHAAGKAMASAWLEAGAATKPQKRHGRVYARPTGAMLARRALSYNKEERALFYNREARAL